MYWDDKRSLKIKSTSYKNSILHTMFNSQFLDKTPIQFKKYWQTLICMGPGKCGRPVFLKSEDEVIEYIASTEGAIGYVSFKVENNNKIKIIEIGCETEK